MKSLAFALIVTLGGCMRYNAFQPPPQLSASWGKSGTSETEVTEALLECGFNEPRGRVPGLAKKMSLQDDALATLCMENDGFIPLYENSYNEFCRNFPHVSACSPNVGAPLRNPEKRINSQFCKAFPVADVCG